MFIIGINDIVSIDSITLALISCYDYDAQTDMYLVCFQGSRPTEITTSITFLHSSFFLYITVGTVNQFLSVNNVFIIHIFFSL